MYRPSHNNLNHEQRLVIQDHSHSAVLSEYLKLPLYSLVNTSVYSRCQKEEPSRAPGFCAREDHHHIPAYKQQLPVCTHRNPLGESPGLSESPLCRAPVCCFAEGCLGGQSITLPVGSPASPLCRDQLQNSQATQVTHRH